MSNLPGNPHFKDAAESCAQLVDETTANDHYIAEQGLTDEVMQFSALNRIAEATLALAYEQRTANLIAMQAMGITDLTDWIPEHADAWIERADAIEKRLGETK